MEPDDLLCSRNAHDKNVLVRRAQWKINQPPSPEEKISEHGRINWMDVGRTVHDTLYQTISNYSLRSPTL